MMWKRGLLGDEIVNHVKTGDISALETAISSLVAALPASRSKKELLNDRFGKFKLLQLKFSSSYF